MIRRYVMAILASCMFLSAQSNPVAGDGATTMIFPPPAVAFDELKQFLGLSEAQVEQLRRILEEKSNERQKAFEQVVQKQNELNALLQNGSRDVVRIGQLTLDIHLLLAQPEPPGLQWRQRALAVLTPEQRTKLATLDQAMKLYNPAQQAVTLDLIDPPPPGRPIPLGLPESSAGAARTAPVVPIQRAR